MKVAYIVGPYKNDDPEIVKENIRRASAAAANYWKLGYAVICLHRNAGSFAEWEVTEQSILEGGYELLRRSDVVVVLSGWETSAGSKVEFDLALELNKEIILEQYGGQHNEID